MRSRRMISLSIPIILAASLFGQAPPPDPVFEVADLRLNISGSDPQSVNIADGRVAIRNVALRPLIAAAHEQKKTAQIGCRFTASAMPTTRKPDMIASLCAPPIRVSSTRGFIADSTNASPGSRWSPRARMTTP